MTLCKTALKYLEAGLSIIPAGQNKRATLEWGPYQRNLPSMEQVQAWFLNGTRNLALIGGAVSGNVEMIDFDINREALPAWENLISEENHELLTRLYFEWSPHGAHVIYRCLSEVIIPGNTKLARKLIPVATPGMHPHPVKGKPDCEAFQYQGEWIIGPELIETRGTGGYCLVNPSSGYTQKHGDLCSLPVLTQEERDILIDAARSLEQVLPEVRQAKTQEAPTRAGNQGLMPGEDFDQRGDVRALLERHRWTPKGYGNDGRERWARPGKEKGKAFSATLTEGRIFYCFSSNGYPFEVGKGYGPFGVYALLEHGGDFKAAGKALSEKGYGSKLSPKESAGRKPRFLNSEAMQREFGKVIEWLWRDQVPKANPVIYAGREGAGKSSGVAQICKEIVLSNPRFWVLWVATEGFVSDHSDKWRKLRIPDQVVMLSDDKGVYKLQLDNWKDREFLDQSIDALKREKGGEVVAVVIDSIRGMQGMGENDPKIAGVMSLINSVVCDKHKASCIYIAHHKKGKEEIRLNKVAGGTGITSSVRAVYSVERVSEFVCRIIPDKSNALGHTPKTYKSILIEDDEGFEISIVEDVGQEDESKSAKAQKFLIALFREQVEYPVRDIWQRGALEGLSADILKKAKANLPIETIHETPKSPWIWRCSLYKQNLSPCTKSGEIENTKSNDINQGEQGEQNSGIYPKKATGRTEGTERTGGNKKSNLLSVTKPNDINQRAHIQKTKSENIRESIPLDPDIEALDLGNIPSEGFDL